MRNSSAQLRLDLTQSDASSASQQSTFVSSNSSADSPNSLDDQKFLFGSAGRNDISSAIAARMAGRMNAAQVSEAEIADLLRKRQDLLDRKFSGTFGRSDEIRLEYVRWNLDRIDDSRHGAALDQLEAAVLHYEQLRRDIQGLQSALKTVKK